MPYEFWQVYNYISRQWYETEYGAVDWDKRWYYPAMIALERIAGANSSSATAEVQ